MDSRRLLIWGVVAAAALMGGNRTAEGTSFLETVNRRLNLQVSRLADLDFTPDPATGQVFVEIEIEPGTPWTLELWRHSLRSDTFQVLVDDGNGLHAHPAPPIATWRGRVMEESDSRIRATLVGNRMWALIFTATGSWAIQPVEDAGVRGEPGQHVVYRSEHVIPTDHECGVTATLAPGAPGPVPFGTGLKIAEIGLDADHDYYLLNSSSVNATIQDMENVINTVESIYDNSPTGIVYEITTVIIRTTSGSPYTLTSPSGLLNQFANTWNSPPESFIARDVAHLFTGKDLTDSIIGIADTPGVCEPFNHYALSQSRFSSNFTARTALTAHELGHNWSALHCDSLAECRIMCSGIGGCDGLSPLTFAATAQTQITNWRNQVGCLLNLADPQSVPFTEKWQNATIASSRWTFVDGVVINGAAENEPSPTLSLNLDAAGADDFQDNEIRSNVIELAGVNDPVLQYFTQHRGVEAGEKLIVEYLSNTLNWVLLNSINSSGVDQSVFDIHSHHLPSSARHNSFRVRFRTEVNQSNDDWYLDDITITDGPPTQMPQIDSVFPAGGSTLGGTLIRVLGSGFTADAQVLFDLQTLTNVTFVSSSEIEAITPAGEAGSVDVVVTQSGGADVVLDGFTYSDSRLVIESNAAAVGTANHPVLILGDHDAGLDGYSFGVTFDDEVISIQDVTEVGTVAEGADFFAANTVNPDYWTLGVVINIQGPGNIPPGKGNVLAIATYNVSTAVLPGTVSLMELADGIGSPSVFISFVQEGIEIVPQTQDGILTIVNETPFIRGDADFDSFFNALSDGLHVLRFGFSNGPPPPCFDAADADDSGEVNALQDALYMLTHGFAQGPPPPAPYPKPGTDPTADSLTCEP